MGQIGIFDLKTHFSEILLRVEAGEEFIVTKRGVPVAILSSPTSITNKRQAKFFTELKQMLKNAPLAEDSDDLRNIREEERR